MLLVRDELRMACGPSERGRALTIGVFDGVHRGHRALVEYLKREAEARGLDTGVVTFHPNPVTVLRPDVTLVYLTTLEQRVELLRGLDPGCVAVVQFTSELALVSAEEFARILVQEAGMRLLVVGEDFAFGRGREGTVARLREIGAELGFEVAPLPLLAEDGDRVSSTRVRGALAEGDMEQVTALLGRPFAVRGPVLHGDERGRSIGFPTLNVGVSPDEALPPNGVYVTRAEVDGRTLLSTTNVGTQPTFDGTHRRVETYLLDFEGDLYGHVARVEFLKRLREERKFNGPDELVEQIRRDVEATRAYAA